MPQDPNRGICYPSKIPVTSEELLTRVDDVLNQLRQQLSEHVVVGTKGLRLQVCVLHRMISQNSR